MSSCARPFDEELLSGYLDGALPQASAQKVRIHLEDCGDCGQLLDEMRTLREAARSTRFEAPLDAEWPELPQTKVSWFSRSLGWTVLVAWTVVFSAITLWRFLASHDDPLDIFMTLGLPGGLMLLFASVALDRFRELKTDRYREVHR